MDTNLGYVWYRKDAPGKYGIGIRQADKEENPQYVDNFALFNAPPGTTQQMAVYFYASADAATPTRQSVMAFTHGDTFKALPGYKTMVNHFHLRFTERLRAGGSLDTTMQDIVAMKALGLNIVGLSDFHGDLHPNDAGAVRFKDQKDYAEASRKASDKDFLVTPWEEPSAFFGGHYNIMFPKNVYWSKVRQPGQPFTENDPVYGKVYHTGSSEDVQQMLDAEGAYWYHAHPRTKGTTGYPDLIFDKAWTKNDRYLGVAFKPGMGMDLSEQRMCEWRCFDVTDTMNNKLTNSGQQPKYIIADIDTYQKGPEDDLYPNFPVNYLKLDKVPAPDEDWSPVLKALRNGEYFVSTGEILIKDYKVDGAADRAYDRGRRRVDLSAVVRRGRLGRRHEGRSADHPGDRPRSVRDQALRDPVRRQGQVVGPLRGVGFGGERRLRPAGLAQGASHLDGRVALRRRLASPGHTSHER